MSDRLIIYFDDGFHKKVGLVWVMEFNTTFNNISVKTP